MINSNYRTVAFDILDTRAQVARFLAEDAHQLDGFRTKSLVFEHVTTGARIVTFLFVCYQRK